MEIPITLTITVNIPDEFLNGHKPKAEPAAVEVPEPIKKVRGPVAPPAQRFGGVSITPLLGKALQAGYRDGKFQANDYPPLKYATVSSLWRADLLKRHQVIAHNKKGQEVFKWEYELTDLGLEALMWYEENYPDHK